MAACGLSVPSPEECPGEITSAALYDPAEAKDLPGLYQVTMAATSFGLTRVPFRAQLFLGQPDSLRRYYPERYRDKYALLGQQLGGVWTQPVDSTVYVDDVFFDNNILYLGCRICLDASSTQFTIERMGPTGFWGRWEDPQTGISRVYDTAGRPLPNPAGIYCAVRLDSSPTTVLEPASEQEGA